MIRQPPQQPFGPTDRIAALAEATERYAERLADHDLANVYWGRSLGLWQALDILAVDRPGSVAKGSPRFPRVRCPARSPVIDRSAGIRPLAAQASSGS